MDYEDRVVRLQVSLTLDSFQITQLNLHTYTVEMSGNVVFNPCTRCHSQLFSAIAIPAPMLSEVLFPVPPIIPVHCSCHFHISISSHLLLFYVHHETNNFRGMKSFGIENN